MDSFRNAISEKTWFGFDLDDTLHEFRKAFGSASMAIFTNIHELNNNVTIEALKSTYSSILKEKTSNAFSDGRTSSEYRRERFEALLLAHGIHYSPELLETFLKIYESKLAESLQLKSGALELLRRLKTLEKKIIIVTEGPKDAQEWTIERLGLASSVDILITTNEMKLTKTQGLFGKVLERFNVAPQDMVYVGDSMERDIEPAMREGIMAVLYDERANCNFDETNGVLSLNSLAKIGNLID